MASVWRDAAIAKYELSREREWTERHFLHLIDCSLLNSPTCIHIEIQVLLLPYAFKWVFSLSPTTLNLLSQFELNVMLVGMPAVASYDNP